MTLFFDRLLEAPCDDFVDEVKRERNNWVKDPSKVKEATLVAEMINLYTNFSDSGLWGTSSKAEKLIALATKYGDANKKQKKQSGGPPKGSDPKAGKTAGKASNGSKVEPWRTKFAGFKTTHNGEHYKWCAKHGHPNPATGKQPGMYMPADHDHDAWAKNKADRDAAFKQKKATGKRKAEESSKPEKSVDDKLKGQRLALSKTFRTALVTEMQVSDAAAEAIVDNVMANATDAELADFS